MTDDKKEKVLHTRVPVVLDEELRQQAARLGISVSNLVRNILNNAFDLVEDVIHDSANIGRAAASRAAAPAAGQPEAVLGWQELVLSVNAVCGECNEILAKGSPAAVALTTAGLRPDRIVCPTCLKGLHS